MLDGDRYVVLAWDEPGNARDQPGDDLVVAATLVRTGAGWTCFDRDGAYVGRYDTQAETEDWVRALGRTSMTIERIPTEGGGSNE